MSQKPNIVFFILDSVRYDRTSISGHNRDTTPALRQISEGPDGNSFHRAFAHSKHTPKSLASILTGTYPMEHRIGYETLNLNNSIPTVQEKLRESGYTTVGISNNAYGSTDIGLTRGFDRFTLLPKKPLDILKTVGIKPTLEFALNLRSHSAGFQRDIHRHSGAYLTASLVQQELDKLENESDPFFLFVHFNEPHRAYYPPLSWFDTFSDEFEMSPRKAGEFSMDVHHNLEEKIAHGCDFTDDEWTAIKALYDTEIKYTDMFVGDLFDKIQSRFDDTIFVATSDHGEHFGEHGALSHSYALDDALLHVPLVTSGLDVATTTAIVQHTDIMRTVLEEVGIDANWIDGVNIRKETREFAVSQDYEVPLEPILEHNAEFDGTTFFTGTETVIPERTTLRTKFYRYTKSTDGAELLCKIPNETQDVSSDNPEITDKLSQSLEEWFSNRDQLSTGKSQHSSREVSTDIKERLKGMGYLDQDF